MCAAAALALAAGPALSQTTTPRTDTSPTTTPQATTKSPSATTPGTSNQAATGQPQWYSHQANEMRASKLIGTNVVNSANESVCEVNDIMLSKDGQVAAVIVGVGGFLGMGERNVAVDFKSLQTRQDGDNLQVVMNTTKESLKSAPEWRWESANK
jgi:sporulation protein YlmC with PRC-barrel domain